MTKEEVLGTLREIAQNPFPYLAEKKSEGRKIVGSPLADVPSEMIHAAGLFPVTILGTNRPIVKAGAHLPDNACSLSRSNLELVLNYQPKSFDGFVFPQVCDTTQHLSDIWKMTIPSEFFMSFLIPRQVDRPSARRWFYAETMRLKSQLEKYVGHSISNEAVFESARLYNEARRLLREIYRAKRAYPASLTNRGLFDLIRSFCYMDPKDLIPYLKVLVEEFPKDAAGDGNVKAVLSGIVVEPSQLLNILDELNVSIVGDDLTVGTRMIAYDVPELDDPIEALTTRHFNKSPFSPIRDVGTRLYDHLLELYEESGADGIIFFHIKFCESQDYDLPDLKRIMRERKIPMIVLDTEYQSVTKAQTKTRLEAFIESLYGERNHG